MPFETRSVMEQKIDFVKLYEQGSISMSELCRRFAVTRRIGYKWIRRYQSHGIDGLENRSKRPKNSPRKTSHKIEQLVVKVRNSDPEWGAKKIHKILQRDYGYNIKDLPSVTTINNILKRNGLIDQANSLKNLKIQRFEYESSNELWQMDFKGDFLLGNKKRCYPLTMTDDHSRYNLCLQALENQRYLSVKEQLTSVFRIYGLPDKILCDNGSPWGMAGNNNRHEDCRITKIEKWLIRLKIRMIHGRAYHPQTQGKLERYHRTLKSELLNHRIFKSHRECQISFDEWRNKYNYKRPHESLKQETPSTRYVPSNRVYPEKLPEIEYPETDYKRKVNKKGHIWFKGRPHRVGKALYGDYVGVRWEDENQFGVYYSMKKIKTIIFN